MIKKIALIVFMLCIVVFALGCTENVEEIETPYEQTEQGEIETPPALSDEEQITAELNKAIVGVVQVKGVTLDNETKTLEISLKEPAHKDGQHFQELMGFATLDIMPKAEELSETYDYEAVVITCLCMFSQGGEKMQDEGYQAIIAIPDNAGTDWKALENSRDLMGAIEPHALRVYVNPVFK